MRNIQVSNDLLRASSAPHHEYQQQFVRISQWITVLLMLMCATTLLGWYADIPLLRTFSSTSGEMKVNTAVLFIIASMALLTMNVREKTSKVVFYFCSVFLIVFSSVNLTAIILKMNMAIDYILFDYGKASGQRNTSMSPVSSLCFIFFGLSIVAGKWCKWESEKQALALAVFIIAFFGLVGHAFNVRALYQIEAQSSMAIITALAFFMLAVATFTARPQYGWMAVISQKSPQGLVLRWMLPAAVVVPLILAVIDQAGVAAQIYSAASASALYAVLLTMVFIPLIWHISTILRRESEALLKSEQDRRLLAEAATHSNENARALEIRYQQIVSALSEGVVVFDAQGAVQACNPSAETILGLTTNQMKSEKQAITDWHPVDENGNPYPADELPVSIVLREGKSVRSVEFGNVRPDGKTVWLTVNADPIRDDKTSQIVSVVASFMDISTRKQAERELMSSQQRFEGIFKSALDAIIGVDEEQRIVLFNPAAERIFGCPAQEATRLSINHFIPERFRQNHDQIFRNVAHSLPTGRLMGQSAEVVGLRMDGSEFPIEASISQINQDGKRTYFVLLRDISRRVAAEKEVLRANQSLAQQVRDQTAELRLSKQEAERANEAKSNFLANMSHEIRTPLNAILGTAQILSRSGLEGQVSEHVNTIRSAGRSLLALINDILDISKIEAGHFEIEHAPLVLENIISNLLDVMRSSAKTKGIDLSISPIPELKRMLLGDPQRIGQILFNLVGNAIKFTAAGSISVCIEVVEERSEGIELRFSVKDTGIGISQEKRQLLFNPFVQGDSTTHRTYGGTGLGLAISRMLVNLMGGQIGVNSQEGEGSEFWFTVPFAFASEAEARFHPSIDETDAGTERLKGIRILVVDDSAVNLDIACKLLSMEGAVCEVASDGLAAIAQLRAQPHYFDIVLMDVQMPGLDGLEATTQIRNVLEMKHLPIVALTAGALSMQRERAFAAGMNDFITKPFELDRIVSCIRSLVSLPAKVESTPAKICASAEFPEVAGVDVKLASRRLYGDVALFYRALNALRNEFGSSVAEIRSDIANNNFEQARRRIHKLRGHASNIAATTIATHAGNIEGILEKSNGISSSDIEPLLDSLQNALAELIADIPADMETGSSGANDDNPVVDAELFGSLKTALADQNMDALDIFGKIRDSLLAKHGNDAVSLLQDQIETLRFREALATLAGWAE